MEIRSWHAIFLESVVLGRIKLPLRYLPSFITHLLTSSSKDKLTHLTMCIICATFLLYYKLFCHSLKPLCSVIRILVPLTEMSLF